MPIQNKDTVAASVPTPPLGSTTLFTDAGLLRTKDDTGTVITLAAGGTVTSIGVVGNDGITASGGPITSSGSITLDLGNITPTSVAASGTVTGSNLSGSSSGTNTGDQTITLTGDVTGSGTGSFATTLSNTTVVPGAYSAANITVDAKGRITSAANGIGGGGSVTSVSVTTANGVSGSVATPTTTPAITLTLGAITPTSVAAVGTVTGSNISGTNTGDQTITLTGAVTGSGTGSFATTLSDTAVVPGTYTLAGITVNAQGRITSATNGTITPAGANTEIQFNNSGVLGSSPSLTWDGSGMSINGNLTLTGLANRIIGNTTSATQNDRMAVQSSSANSRTNLDVIPSGTDTFASVRLFDNSDRTNASYLYAGVSGTPGYNFVGSAVTGTGTVRGLLLGVNGVNGLRVHVDGDAGIGTDAVLTTTISGLPYISAVAGQMTSIPSGMTGLAPLVIDTTNNQITFYSGGAWRKASAPNAGTAVLVAGSVTVSTALIGASSIVLLTVQALGTVTVPTAVAIGTRVPGVSFDIISADITDTSTVAWSIV